MKSSENIKQVKGHGVAEFGKSHDCNFWKGVIGKETLLRVRIECN